MTETYGLLWWRLDPSSHMIHEMIRSGEFCVVLVAIEEGVWKQRIKWCRIVNSVDFFLGQLDCDCTW